MARSRSKAPNGNLPVQDLWRRGITRLTDQGKLMWLLGEGLNAALSAQAQILSTRFAGIITEMSALLGGQELNWHSVDRCINEGLRNGGWRNVKWGLTHCINILHNRIKLQEVCETMLIGYARVSTHDQDTTAQISALEAAGCELVFREKASGGRWNRPELHKLLDKLRKNDVVVVWKLDRLSRSLKDILTLMEEISKAGAGFRSLTEAIDTTSAGGRMMMQMVGTFAEFERTMLKERTRIGLDAARQQGRIGGRRPKLKAQQQQEIIQLVSSGQKTAADAARLFNVHPATISRLLQRAKPP